LRTGWRGIRRTLPRCLSREELWSGNRESLTKTFFSKDSIFRWLATSYGRRKREYRNLFDNGDYANATKIEFRTPKDAERALRGI